MKPRVLSFLVMILISSLVTGCYKDDDENNECIEYDPAYVTSVNAPSAVKVKDATNIEVSFGVYNTCGNFGKFIESQEGNVKTIEVVAAYENCNGCFEMPMLLTVNYEFKACDTGEYVLHFKSGSTDFKTVNLTAN